MRETRPFCIWCGAGAHSYAGHDGRPGQRGCRRKMEIEVMGELLEEFVGRGEFTSLHTTSAMVEREYR